MVFKTVNRGVGVWRSGEVAAWDVCISYMPGSIPGYSTSNTLSCSCASWEAANDGSGTWAPTT